MELTAPSGPWLFSRRVDILAFGLPVAMALFLVALRPILDLPQDETPAWAWLGTVLLVDVAHVWGTLFRVYTDAAELRRRLGIYAGVPLTCWGAAALVYNHSAMGFWRALAYIAVWHFIRQQIGWVRLYGQREGARGAWHAWLDQGTIYAATLYPLVWWHTHLPRSFAWMMQGDFVALPAMLEPAAAVLFAGTIALYAARAVWLAWHGCVRWGKDIVVVGTLVCWFVGIVVFDSDYIFTVTNVLIHGVPYGVLIYVYGRHQHVVQDASRGGLFAGSMVPLLMVLWILAGAEEYLWDHTLWHERPWLFGSDADLEGWQYWLVPTLAVPQLTHYVLDGFVWRRAHNPTLVGLFSQQACAASKATPALSRRTKVDIATR